MLVSDCIKPLKVIKDIWLVIFYKPDNNDVIQIFNYILSIAESLKKLDNYYNIPKKDFTSNCTYLYSKFV